MLWPAEGVSGAGPAAGAPAAGTAAPAAGSGTPAATPGTPAVETGAGTAARNWEKDYGDLEGRHKAYEKYGTPEQIENALRWASYGADIKARLDRGEYVPRGERQPERPAAATADPFDTWDELTPRQQAKLLADQALETVRREALDPFKKEIGGQLQGTQGQQQLLLKIVQAMIRNPSLDPADILTRATEMATLPPDKLLERAVELAAEPANRSKAIDDAVKQAIAAERARVLQEAENENLKSFSSSRHLSIVPKTAGSRREARETAMREMAQLAAQGDK